MDLLLAKLLHGGNSRSAATL